MTDPGVELALTPPHATAVIAGNTPDEILEHAGQIAERLKHVIESQGLAVSVGRDRKHVEVSGWQAAGAMLGALGGQALHAETDFCRRVWDDRESDEIAYEARVEVKTLDGKIVGAAEALCSSAEKNWRGSDEFAIKSMAETRAESRAYRRAIGWVVSMAGYSPTPAEEMRAETTAPKLPAWASPAPDITKVAHALTALFKAAGAPEPGKAAVDVGNQIFKDCSDTVPVCVARAVEHIVFCLNEITPDERATAGMADAFHADEPVDATVTEDNTPTDKE